MISVVRAILIHCFVASHTPRPEAIPDSHDDWPRLHIVVPARNEQRDLATCIEALLAQDYPDFRLTIVNDRSEDDTLAIAESYAAKDERLNVISIEELPTDEVWTGKAHAMWVAAEQAEASGCCLSTPM